MGSCHSAVEPFNHSTIQPFSHSPFACFLRFDYAMLYLSIFQKKVLFDHKECGEKAVDGRR